MHQVVSAPHTIDPADPDRLDPEVVCPRLQVTERREADPLAGHHEVVEAVGDGPPPRPVADVLVDEEPTGLEGGAGQLQDRASAWQRDVVYHVDDRDHLKGTLGPWGADVEVLEPQGRLRSPGSRPGRPLPGRRGWRRPKRRTRLRGNVGPSRRADPGTGRLHSRRPARRNPRAHTRSIDRTGLCTAEAS
jgi:hypothetical protein